MNRKKHRPPQWADWFLEWYCAPQFIEETQGDLHEAFHRRCKEVGPRLARWLFAVDVLRSSSFRTFDYSLLPSRNSLSMLRNYTKLTFRNLLRKKVFSFVNILGLAIGMAAFFLIIQYVSFEWGYDRFHENSDRIYRVYLERHPARHRLMASNHPGTGPALKDEYPEVEDYARMLPQSLCLGKEVTLSHVGLNGQEKVFFEENIYIVDPSFLTVLSFPLKYGDAATALTDPTSIVISESVANKYFETEDPLGKTLTLNGEKSFKVTAVLKDIPGNSHIKFDILTSFWITENIRGNFDAEGLWRWAEFYTYVRLARDVDAKSFEAKLDDFLQRHNGEYLKRMKLNERLRLQPLTDIHLRTSPEMTNEREVHGSVQTVYFLLLIAAFIIVIAWINYINLSTSKSLERAREIGVRKVAGALKRQLITQFLFESATINFIAIILSFFLTAVAYPYFTELTGKNIGSNLFEAGLIEEPLFWLVVSGIFFAGSFFAGFYPAFMLSSFKVISALKGKFFGSQSGIALRKVLVTSQFIISIALIAGTIMIFNQVQFMRNHELGFAKDQLLVIRPPRVIDPNISQRVESFKAELKSTAHVHNITVSSEIPGGLVSNRNGIRRLDEPRDAITNVYHYYVDDAFIPTYGLTIIAGRNFTEAEGLNSPDASSNPIILNRKIIETLGYKNPEEAVNELVYFGLGSADWIGEIVGIVENFSQRSLKTDYEPLIFVPAPRAAFFTVNLDMTNLPQTMSFVTEKYEMAFPLNPFDYFFMDDHFNRQYIADRQFGKVLGLFTCLALIITGLGLYGLTLFMVTQRTKELALRRILGASLSNIVSLFSKDFVRLIIISNIIALPVVYFLADRWLDNFAFRIDIGWIVFVVPLLILLTISLTTVGFQTIKTGLTNPVNSLRSE